MILVSLLFDRTILNTKYHFCVICYRIDASFVKTGTVFERGKMSIKNKKLYNHYIVRFVQNIKEQGT